MLADLARAGQVRRSEPWPIYDQALIRDPHNLIILADAAAAAVALGEYPQARRYLRRGRDLAPTWARLLAEEGVLALAEGRLAEAEQGLRTALQGDWAGEVEAVGRAEGLLALTYLQMGQNTNALAQADDLLRRHPDAGPFQVATRWVRATALERLGRPVEACLELRRVLAMRPDHVEAARALARLSR
jgi:tetratricopeptide (TPR) repeat protein